MSSGHDPAFADLLRMVDEFGWAIRHVGAGTKPGEAAFSYTVGLTALGHPEVVITGMPFKPAQIFLNNIGSDIRDGRRFEAGTVTEDLAPAPVVFLTVVQDEELTAVRQVYGTCSAVQMVWPDSAGRLPWVDGYNNPPDAQPLLGPAPYP
jgi:Domain of unknown function (DUF4262)